MNHGFSITVKGPLINTLQCNIVSVNGGSIYVFSENSHLVQKRLKVDVTPIFNK